MTMLAIRYFCAFCCCFALGCTSTKTSNTARTATEQMLISNAVDQSLAKVDFSSLAGKKVLVEEKYLDSVIDKGYIISSVRHHVLHVGGQLAAKPEEADIILEMRSGGVGTDNSDSFLGMPGVTLPGMVSLPDVKLITRTRQSAFAKLGIVAIDAKTHQELNGGGVSLAMSDDNNWYVMGVGPYRQGSMEKEVKNSLNVGWSAMDAPLPNTVAFKKPTATRRRGREEVAGRIQLTAGDDEPPPAKDASMKTEPEIKPANAEKALFE